VVCPAKFLIKNISFCSVVVPDAIVKKLTLPDFTKNILLVTSTLAVTLPVYIKLRVGGFSKYDAVAAYEAVTA
jgi:hypothetical protein